MPGGRRRARHRAGARPSWLAGRCWSSETRTRSDRHRRPAMPIAAVAAYGLAGTDPHAAGRAARRRRVGARCARDAASTGSPACCWPRSIQASAARHRRSSGRSLVDDQVAGDGRRLGPRGPAARRWSSLFDRAASRRPGAQGDCGRAPRLPGARRCASSVTSTCCVPSSQFDAAVRSAGAQRLRAALPAPSAGLGPALRQGRHVPRRRRHGDRPAPDLLHAVRCRRPDASSTTSGPSQPRSTASAVSATQALSRELRLLNAAYSAILGRQGAAAADAARHRRAGPAPATSTPTRSVEIATRSGPARPSLAAAVASAWSELRIADVTALSAWAEPLPARPSVETGSSRSTSTTGSPRRSSAGDARALPGRLTERAATCGGWPAPTRSSPHAASAGRCSTVTQRSSSLRSGSGERR